MKLRCLFLIIALCAVASRAQLPAPAAATPPPTLSVPLGDIAPRSQAALIALSAIEPAGSADATVTAARDALPDLAERSSALLAGASGGGTSLDNLREREAAARKLSDTLTARAELLYQRAKSFEVDDAQIAQARALWHATDQAASAASAPPDTLGAVRAVLAAADAAAQRVKTNRNAVLDLQSRVGEWQGKVRGVLAAVSAAQASAVRTLGARDSPPLWSSAAQLDAATLAENGRQVAGQRAALETYVLKNWHLFALHGAIVLALLGLFVWLRRVVGRWTEAEPQLQRALPIFAVPAATALALSFFVKGPIYSDAPELLRAVLGATLLFPTLLILRRLLDPRLHRVPTALAVFYFLDQVQVATAAFPRLTRLIFAAQMIGAAATFAWLAWTSRAMLAGQFAIHDAETASAHRAAARWMQPLFWLGSALTLAALLASVAGFTRLSGWLGVATLRSSYVAVVAYAIFSIVRGLLLIVWRARPAMHLRIVREHRALIEARVNRLLGQVTIALWAWETCELFGVWTDLFAATRSFLNAPLGGSFITPGHLIGFGVALWLAALVSRAVRFVLEEEIYQRLQLAPGLPYAISAVVNYGVLLVGFVVALGLLGVDLTKVTIIASAFSVGLGFGLQNVINNFVSGIILLFERPIRVGDVIQMGDASGEVRRIGIRASIIRTLDGADLIVPNGNLISNPVTNWTYSDRARAVELALTLDASPADSTRVLELLRHIATEQTSDHPVKAPQVFITGFTAGRLNVTVRVWASVYEDSARLRSDLSAALFTTLAREKIGLV